MSDLNDLDNIIPGGTFDAFADADKQSQAVTNKEYIHVRTQQRNGRKSLTTVQGLDKKFEYSKGTQARKQERAPSGRGAERRGRGPRRARARSAERGRPPLRRAVLKAFKKEFSCNGTIVDDPEYGHVIQLQGDQRQNVLQFLTANGIAKKDVIKIHGR